MNIYLLRHGQAESHLSSDSSRQLTSTGREDISLFARSFLTTSRTVDRCFVSPLARTQQTAEIFIKFANLNCALESEDRLRPENSALSVIRFLETLEEKNILLIGHNPLLSELFSLLTTGKTASIKVMAAGELCCVCFDIFGLGMGKEVLDILPDKN
ncbi:MAG: phosphohistidine phosphatase SixA [Gammaproteobacteria bacterium]|nr:phosphohistidine phosphatase SixA [Gammaproteobacteria bacterium]